MRWHRSSLFSTLVVLALVGCSGAAARGHPLQVHARPGATTALADLGTPPAANTTTTEDPEPDPHPRSIQAALRFIRRHVDVPVFLPRGVPKGLRLSPDHPLYLTNAGGWELSLVFGHRQHLFIQYGAATFDGCGGDSARPTHVGSRPALIYTTRGSTELVWPATPSQPTGVYGLAGSLGPARMLAMARSMQAMVESSSVDAGC
jgi:hypothetical protein